MSVEQAGLTQSQRDRERNRHKVSIITIANGFTVQDRGGVTHAFVTDGDGSALDQLLSYLSGVLPPNGLGVELT